MMAHVLTWGLWSLNVPVPEDSGDEHVKVGMFRHNKKHFHIKFMHRYIIIAEKQCEPNPCQNGGFCHESYTTGDYRCECPKPYKGTNCEG